MKINAIEPVILENDKLIIIDQTLLPGREEYIELRNREDVWEAIKKLRVRGAPAIGVCAGFGIYIDLLTEGGGGTLEAPKDVISRVKETGEYLKTARPTAVNLFWAADRMIRKAEALEEGLCIEQTASQRVEYIIEELKKEAEAIKREDIEASIKMGEYGLTLLEPGMGILTHCNAGTLATAKYGTCIAPIYLGAEKGYDFKVFADETRPLLQGARLTAFELDKAGVDVTLICDNMAATVMKQGKIQAVVVGCDRAAANGDGANKIGTMQVAIMAKEFGIPFYMFAPTSTIDMETKTGADIEIEERDGAEIGEMWYKEPMTASGVKKFNPAFDVTDHKYITAYVTEKGIIRPPFDEGFRKIMEK